MIVRHAVSIDEKQVLLRPDNMDDPVIDGMEEFERDVQQVWFPGSHQVKSPHIVVLGTQVAV